MPITGSVQYNRVIVRASVILTNSYVAGTIIDNCENFNQLNIFLKFTKGSLTDLDVKVEFSDDGVNYYQETFQALSGDTATETAGLHTFATGAPTSYMLAIPINCSKVKISSIGNGTVTNSLLEVTAVVSNK